MLVEAAGVEPASEKVRHEEPTCVARFESLDHRLRTGKKSGDPARLISAFRLRTEAMGQSREDDAR